VTLIKELAKCDTRLKTPELVPQVRQLLEESRQLLTKQIADIEKQINDHIDKNGDLKDDIDLVESIPGIGKPTAQRIIAEMPIFVPKQNGSSFAAYAGLAPRVRQSGSSIRRTTHLSKCGNSRLRAALYWPAITAIKCNEVIKTFAKRLAEKGKSKMSIIGAVMRKLLILAYGVLKTRQPFDCQFKNNKTFAAIS
jgi:transposase